MHLAVIFHIVYIETHHVTQSVRHKEGYGSRFGGFRRIALHEP